MSTVPGFNVRPDRDREKIGFIQWRSVEGSFKFSIHAARNKVSPYNRYKWSYNPFQWPEIHGPFAFCFS